MTRAAHAYSFDVKLAQHDYLYFNWTLAFERPILPFFMYTFIGLVLASLIGLWPAGRVYASTVLLPMFGYGLFVHLSALRLWRNYPLIRAERRFSFGDRSYSVEVHDSETTVPYAEIATLIESRRGFYLLRANGNADIIPKRLLKDEKGFRAHLGERVENPRRSSFL